MLCSSKCNLIKFIIRKIVRVSNFGRGEQMGVRGEGREKKSRFSLSPV